MNLLDSPPPVLYDAPPHRLSTLLSEAWTASLEALSWVELKGMNEDAALRKTFKLLGVKDRGVANDASDLLYSVLKRRNLLDYMIKSALEPIDLESLEVGLRSFLRLYAYLIHYSGIPYSETHRLSEQVRRVLGNKKLIPVEEAIDLIPNQKIPWGSFSHDEELAYRNFLPVWYVRYLNSRFDERNAAYLIQSIDTPKYIRVNTLRGDDSLIFQLTKQGFQFDDVKGLSHTFRVLGASNGLTNTEFYRRGSFILQDKASILVGEIAAPKPHDVVLDVCAAPGVKTSHLAQIMGNRGRIISVDFDERRLASWRRLVEKMGVTNAESMLVDATSDYSLPIKKADLVVLDPPCSGTGTFNNIPSAKWRVTQRSIEEMADLQKILIEKAASNVKKGGSLVYSTCSVTVEENEEVIRGFLKVHPEFKLVEAKPRLGASGLLGLDEAQRLYPSVHESEGFFIAKLENSECTH